MENNEYEKMNTKKWSGIKQMAAWTAHAQRTELRHGVIRRRFRRFLVCLCAVSVYFVPLISAPALDASDEAPYPYRTFYRVQWAANGGGTYYTSHEGFHFDYSELVPRAKFLEIHHGLKIDDADLYRSQAKAASGIEPLFFVPTFGGTLAMEGWIGQWAHDFREAALVPGNEAWLLREADGTPVTFRGYDYHVNWGSNEAVDKYVELMEKLITERPHLDGIRLDNIFRAPQPYTPLERREAGDWVIPIDPNTNEPVTGENYRLYVTGALKKLKARLHAHGKFLAANAAIISSLSDANIRELIPTLDVMLDEAYAWNYVYQDQRRPHQNGNWEVRVAAFYYANKHGVAGWQGGYGATYDTFWDTYGIASLLLAKEGFSGHGWAIKHYLDALGEMHAGDDSQFRKYDYDLGRPLNDLYMKDGVYQRDFENGRVIVNVDTNSHDVQIEPGVFTDVDSGALVTADTITFHEIEDSNRDGLPDQTAALILVGPNPKSAAPYDPAVDAVTDLNWSGIDWSDTSIWHGESPRNADLDLLANYKGAPGSTDYKDLQYLDEHWGLREGEMGYGLFYDLDRDGVVGQTDVDLMSAHYTPTFDYDGDGAERTGNDQVLLETYVQDHLNIRIGSAGYDPLYDLNGNGVIDYADSDVFGVAHVTLDVLAADGAVAVSPNQDDYWKNQVVVLSIDSEGTKIDGKAYVLDRWRLDLNGVARDISLTMDGSKKVMPVLVLYGDLDLDGDVDQFDFLKFSNCYSAYLTGQGPGANGCTDHREYRLLDYNGDGVFNMHDFLSLSNNFGGSSIPGDLDLDGDVDVRDFIRFSNCFGGKDIPYQRNSSCTYDTGYRADMDKDGDVDTFDFWNYWYPEFNKKSKNF